MVKKKATTKKATTKKSRSSKATKSKSKKTNDVSLDSGIVIVDDDIAIDKDIVNEERRAYLEEARSQDAAE